MKSMLMDNNGFLEADLVFSVAKYTRVAIRLREASERASEQSEQSIPKQVCHEV